MTKKTRLIMLAVCAVLFLIITPYIVLYSLGYRVDIKKMRVVATGGMYVKAMPQGLTIIIDHNIDNTTGIFSNSVFVQNLLPGGHSIQIKKDGYYDYQKNLEVQEKSVTKLEHVLLFKKNISFGLLPATAISPFDPKIIQDVYVIKNSNLYYSNIKSNAALTLLQKNTPVIKNLAAYKISGGSIIWLGLDGLLYSSDLQGKNTQTLSLVSLKIDLANTYTLFVFGQNIFLKAADQTGKNSSVLIFDATAKSFVNFYSPVSDIKLSPNGQKILYFNDHEILYSLLNSTTPDPVFLNRFSEKITDAFWLNDDYIVLSLGNKILISEIDVRDNINTIELPQTVTIANQSITIKNPKISFNQSEKKLYILTDNSVLVSERLTP